VDLLFTEAVVCDGVLGIVGHFGMSDEIGDEEDAAGLEAGDEALGREGQVVEVPAGSSRSPTTALALRVGASSEVAAKRSLYALTMFSLRSMPTNSVAWPARMLVIVPGPQA
jgi:hypothetical protein